jgi:hypothetical protein
MKELIAALLLAHLGSPVSLDHQDNIERAKRLVGPIKVSDGKEWHLLFTKEYILAFLNQQAPLAVGSIVLAPYKDVEKEGTIKAVGFQVDGLGNKFYSEEELKRR